MGKGMIIACMQFGEIEVHQRLNDHAGLNGWGLQPCHTLTVNCTLRSSIFLTGAVRILSLLTSHLTDIGSHIQFSDTSVGGLKIYLVRIELSLHS